MATIRRSRTFQASPEELWAIVGSAHHLPRWWPRVTRVESVDDDAFTQVLETATGKPIRADFRVESSTEPSERSWVQEVAGTPFERILARSRIAIRLQPEGDATRVELSMSQRPRGLALLGAFMMRSAARRQLDEALDGLAALIGPRVWSASAGSSTDPPAAGR